MGGWRALTGMKFQDVDKAERIYWAAARKGLRPNYRVTINPPVVEGESFEERRKRISRVPDWIRDHLRRRRGQPDIALVIWQWPLGGRLHCHMLIYVAPENDDYMARWHQLPDYHVEEAYDVGALRYCLRERLPGPPAWEARRRNAIAMVCGTRFAGQRLTLSPAAKALDTLGGKKRQVSVVPEPAPAPIVYTVDATGQFQLFDEPAEPVSLETFRRGRMPAGAAAELEDRRRRLGLTQQELGRLAGLSQPQIANVVAGRFGLSRFAAARLQSVLQAAA